LGGPGGGAASLEAVGSLRPVFEDAVDRGIVEELFEEDVGFQGFELGQAEEGAGVGGVVVVQEFLGEVAVVLADVAFVFGVVVMSPGSPPGTKMIGASDTLSRSVNV